MDTTTYEALPALNSCPIVTGYVWGKCTGQTQARFVYDARDENWWDKPWLSWREREPDTIPYFAVERSHVLPCYNAVLLYRLAMYPTGETTEDSPFLPDKARVRAVLGVRMRYVSKKTKGFQCKHLKQVLLEAHGYPDRTALTRRFRKLNKSDYYQSVRELEEGGLTDGKVQQMCRSLFMEAPCEVVTTHGACPLALLLKLLPFFDVALLGRFGARLHILDLLLQQNPEVMLFRASAPRELQPHSMSYCVQAERQTRLRDPQFATAYMCHQPYWSVARLEQWLAQENLNFRLPERQRQILESAVLVWLHCETQTYYQGHTVFRRTDCVRYLRKHDTAVSDNILEEVWIYLQDKAHFGALSQQTHAEPDLKRSRTEYYQTTSLHQTTDLLQHQAVATVERKLVHLLRDQWNDRLSLFSYESNYDDRYQRWLTGSIHKALSVRTIPCCVVVPQEECRRDFLRFNGNFLVGLQSVHRLEFEAQVPKQQPILLVVERLHCWTLFQLYELLTTPGLECGELWLIGDVHAAQSLAPPVAQRSVPFAFHGAGSLTTSLWRLLSCVRRERVTLQDLHGNPHERRPISVPNKKRDLNRAIAREQSGSRPPCRIDTIRRGLEERNVLDLHLETISSYRARLCKFLEPLRLQCKLWEQSLQIMCAGEGERQQLLRTLCTQQKQPNHAHLLFAGNIVHVTDLGAIGKIQEVHVQSQPGGHWFHLPGSSNSSTSGVSTTSVNNTNVSGEGFHPDYRPYRLTLQPGSLTVHTTDYVVRPALIENVRQHSGRVTDIGVFCMSKHTQMSDIVLASKYCSEDLIILSSHEDGRFREDLMQVPYLLNNEAGPRDALEHHWDNEL